MTNVGERGFEVSFAQLLTAEGLNVLQGPAHHPFEHGKDIIARAADGSLYAFQLKGGDIDLSSFERIQGQLLALAATAIAYPGVEPPRRPDRAVLVATGTLTPPARSRLDAFNHAHRHLGLPLVECVEREHLVSRFCQAHGHYLPSSPIELNRFLSFYLSTGEGPFPVRSYLALLESVVLQARADLGQVEVKRAVASAALITAYCTGPWERTQNHVAVAEGWLCFIVAQLRVVATADVPEEQWRAVYSLALERIKRALGDLLEEAVNADDLVIPDIVDGIVYPTRALLVCGYLSAFLLSERIAGVIRRHDEAVRKVLLRELRYVRVLGESCAPFLITISNALDVLDDPKESAKLIVSYAIDLMRANRPNSEVALPAPYVSHEDMLMWSIGADEPPDHNQFDGGSYTLHIAIDWLARRDLRPVLEALWKDATRIHCYEFKCSQPEQYLASNDPEGTLSMWPLGPQDSWRRLSQAAKVVEEASLPAILWREAEIIPYLGLLLPYRFTSDLAKAIEYLTTRRAEVKLCE